MRNEIKVSRRVDRIGIKLSIKNEKKPLEMEESYSDEASAILSSLHILNKWVKEKFMIH